MIYTSEDVIARPAIWEVGVEFKTKPHGTDSNEFKEVVVKVLADTLDEALDFGLPMAQIKCESEGLDIVGIGGHRGHYSENVVFSGDA